MAQQLQRRRAAQTVLLARREWVREKCASPATARGVGTRIQASPCTLTDGKLFRRRSRRKCTCFNALKSTLPFLHALALLDPLRPRRRHTPPAPRKINKERTTIKKLLAAVQLELALEAHDADRLAELLVKVDPLAAVAEVDVGEARAAARLDRPLVLCLWLFVARCVLCRISGRLCWCLVRIPLSPLTTHSRSATQHNTTKKHKPRRGTPSARCRGTQTPQSAQTCRRPRL